MKVYNIKDAGIYLRSIELPPDLNREIEGIAQNGLSIKFDSTAESHTGIGGYTSYSIKSGRGATVTIDLLGTSDHTSFLLDVYNEQLNGDVKPFKLIVFAKNESFSFERIILDNCFIIEVDRVDFSKNAVEYSFTIKCGDMDLLTDSEGINYNPQKLAGRTPSEVYVR